MTDTITRARKEWCEPSINEPPPDYSGYYWDGVPYQACSPEVVALLLSVLEGEMYNDYCCICGEHTSLHEPGCRVAVAEAAITRALEVTK